MCGRYKLIFDADALAARFAAILGDVTITPKYNIAPGTFEPIVRVDNDARKIEAYWWGLVPHWAKEKSFGARTVNARSETVAEKPAFRAALRQRRCLVPADGYYEWKVLPGGGKQPYLFKMASNEPFAFGGLWETWNGPDGTLHSFCTITTAPNELCARVHDRMPVIIAPADYDQWLDPTVKDATKAMSMIRSFPSEEMISYPVSMKVNSVRNQAPEVAEPLDAPVQGELET